MHPLLVAFPLGMLGASVLFDAAALALAEPVFADIGRYDQGIGLVAAAIAGAFALVDLAVVPRTAAMGRVALERAVAHGGALVLFGAALVLRTVSRAPLPSPAGLLLAALGLAPAALAASLALRLTARA
ncbi:MAG: hypothetical protein QM820_42665 [Minicystis sp.]